MMYSNIWCKTLNSLLKKGAKRTGLVCVDLFAGCGGLGLGFEVAGFETFGYELDTDAASTYEKNLGKCENANLEVGMALPSMDVLIGGPPCQPFSVRGKQLGPRDSRDGFPAFLDFAERYEPKIVIIENVRGLYYKNRDYLLKISKELENLGYLVSIRLINAHEYGVPQKRERVFIVASKVGWIWPLEGVFGYPTAGEAIFDTHDKFDENSKFLTPSMDQYIATYEKKSQCINPRDLNLNRPSRTVTCRNLGGGTSDMMRIKLHDTRRRMLSHREAARIQSFPDWYEFVGSDYKVYEQIGNAVPPLLSYQIANSASECLKIPTDTIVKAN